MIILMENAQSTVRVTIVYVYLETLGTEMKVCITEDVH
mgnify:FL=1